MRYLTLILSFALALNAQFTPPAGGGGGGGATIPSTTNVISGSGTGNGADAGFAPSAVVLNTSTYSNPGWITAIANAKVTGLNACATVSTGASSTYVRGDCTVQTLNAAAVANAVDTTSTYSNPAWITALANAKVTGLTAFATLATGASSTYVRGDGTTQTLNAGAVSGLTAFATLATGTSSQYVRGDGVLATLTAGGITPTASTFASIGACSTTAFMKLLTDSYYNFVLCDGASTLTYFADGKQNFPPAAASNWTVVSTAGGTATAADLSGGVVFSDTSATFSGIQTMIKAVPATPYTKIMKVRSMTGTDASHGVRCGAVWTNGTTTSSANMGIEATNAGTATPGIVVISNTDYQFGGQAVQATYNSPYFLGGDIWYKLADDGTTKSLALSVDGRKFTTFFSTPHATTLTPTNYGLLCSTDGIGFATTLISDQ